MRADRASPRRELTNDERAQRPGGALAAQTRSRREKSARGGESNRSNWRAKSLDGRWARLFFFMMLRTRTNTARRTLHIHVVRAITYSSEMMEMLSRMIP